MSNGRFAPMGGWGFAGSSERRVPSAPRAVDVMRARQELLSAPTSPVLGEEVALVPTEAAQFADQAEVEAEVVVPEPQFTEFPIAEI